MAFARQGDFAHMCCAADLVDDSMFLQRLQTHRVRDMVASASRDDFSCNNNGYSISVGHSVSCLCANCSNDFAHMSCVAVLVAASVFLQSLEVYEVRDMVAAACRGASWLEQPDEVEDECFGEEPHASYVFVPHFEV